VIIPTVFERGVGLDMHCLAYSFRHMLERKLYEYDMLLGGKS
jgi:hypothetical protein